MVQSVAPYPTEPETDDPLVPEKVDMVAEAVRRYGLKSILDVGGCWGVNGGYAFHALKAGAERATILDGHITQLTIDRARGLPVTLREGNIGDSDLISPLPHHDAAIFFNVLLHQVAPNWDEFLWLYASRTDHFIIFNQDWDGSCTIRFHEQGPDWYIANTPETDRARVLDWYRKHDEIVPWLGKPWRDAHHFWQWGISKDDLVICMASIGFNLDQFRDFGPYAPERPRIVQHGYFFSRK